MNIQERYESAKEIYAGLGVDVDAAVERLNHIPVSMHCWQGDDVMGFEGADSLSGGIQATGNYPGKARNPQELMADIDKALNLIPGRHRINLHASYAIFQDGEKVDRDALEPRHFADWVKFAKEKGLGLDFNPTMFSHPKAENATLSSEDPEIRKFWIDHCKACVRISQYFAEELGSPCAMNIWIPDGFKDIPADRMSPRARLKDSLDQILAMDYDKSKVLIAVESKVFGIGMESCTVGSHEFYMNYAASRGIMCLLDSGHFHPTEMISDKISSMLLFSDKIALHVSRPVRWDSDHVVLLDDETQAIASEIIRHNLFDRVHIGLDFFDASINRIAAWVIGTRNMKKALLRALLEPTAQLRQLENDGDYTARLALLEEQKSLPWQAIWEMYCQRHDTPAGSQWLDSVRAYENAVLSQRG